MSSSSDSSQDSYRYCKVTISSKGKQIASDGGFTYIKDRAVKDKIYWKCILSKGQPKCYARLITVTIREDPPKYRIQRAIAPVPHCHAPSPTAKQRRDALASMKRKASETRDRPANIILETQSQVSVDAGADMPSHDALRRQIKRARRAGTLREPQTLEEIEIPENLAKTITGEEFVLCNEEFDGDRIIIFATLNSMIKLCRSEIMIMDGTFKTCPLLFRQIYTIHGLVGLGDNRRCVPLVFILMKTKREAAYRKIFEILLEYCDEYGIDLAPRFVLTDFEIAIINAVRIKFPAASHRGCLFHLGQIIYRHVQKEGLQRIYGHEDSEFSIQVRQLVALAFLTPPEIPNAFAAIRSDFDARGTAFINWFATNYVQGRAAGRGHRQPRFPPSMWSVADLMDAGLPRSQNSLEAWHRRFGSLADNKHLGVLKCIEIFRDEAHSVAIQIERLEAGIASNVGAALSKREERIKAVYQDKANRSTIDFLRSLSRHMKFNPVVIDDRADEDEEQE